MLSNPLTLIAGGLYKLNQFVGQSSQAYEKQAVTETKLAAVMRNTIGAGKDEVQSILDLASAQQKLGVIGDEVQLAGAQELATYVSKTDSLQKLIPAMNDMLAQQYGINASQEQAANIAMMMGKVMDGQTDALSRYGYKFDEAQEKILKYGTEAERAATLYDVITASVGGVNEALAQTPEGKLKQHANAAGDLQERVGKLFNDLKAAMPTRGFKGAHFATFPPDLIRTCIAVGCPPDGVVLDPFIGSGTTALVAKELGRNYVGIELNEESVKMAGERLGVCVRSSEKG